VSEFHGCNRAETVARRVVCKRHDTARRFHSKRQKKKLTAMGTVVYRISAGPYTGDSGPHCEQKSRLFDMCELYVHIAVTDPDNNVKYVFD
jgi:hypothetical protein